MLPCVISEYRNKGEKIFLREGHVTHVRLGPATSAANRCPLPLGPPPEGLPTPAGTASKDWARVRPTSPYRHLPPQAARGPPPRPPLPAPHPPPCRPAAPPPTLLPTAKCRKQVGPAGGGGPGRRRAGAPRPGSCAGREGRSWRNPGQGPDAPCGLQEDRRGSAGRPASPGGLRRRGGGGAGTLVRGEMAAETAGPALAALPAPAPLPRQYALRHRRCNFLACLAFCFWPPAARCWTSVVAEACRCPAQAGDLQTPVLAGEGLTLRPRAR